MVGEAFGVYFQQKEHHNMKLKKYIFWICVGMVSVGALVAFLNIGQ